MIRGMDEFGGDKEEGATGGVSVNFAADVRRVSSRKESRDTDTESFTYEHFPVVCPTCRGSGKVHEDDLNKLVSFVPVKDERLRPSRIFWKMLLMLALCACIAAPLAFFLVPRSVTLTLMDIKATKIFVPHGKNLTPYILVNTNLKIVNQNYLGIKIKDVNQKVEWDQLILNPKTCLRNISLQVPSRDHLNQPMEIMIAFEGSKPGTAGFRIRSLCEDGWLNRIMMKFVTTATVSFLTQTSQISFMKYNDVQCYNYSGVSQNPWTTRKR